MSKYHLVRAWREMQNPAPLLAREVLDGFRLGRIQSAGFMQIIPLLAPDAGREFLPVRKAEVYAPGYGEIHFKNEQEAPILIPGQASFMVNLPVQDQALTSAAWVLPGKERFFNQAMCTQQFQGGLMPKGNYPHGFLPYSLREASLGSRYVKSLGKLWSSLSDLNKSFGLRKIGRLRYFINHFKHELDEFVAEFERVPGQRGAIICVDNRIAGIEIAPSAAYWAEIWEYLIRDCYGSLAISYRNFMGSRPSEPSGKIPFDHQVNSLEDVRRELQLLDELEKAQRNILVLDMVEDPFNRVREDQEEGLTLETVSNKQFLGQLLFDQDQMVYASLITKREWFRKELLHDQPVPETRICLVCGYANLEHPPYEEGAPSFETCPCCGTTFGYDDRDWSKSYGDLRVEWMQQGAPWHKPEKRPEVLDLRHQISQIELVYHKMTGLLTRHIDKFATLSLKEIQKVEWFKIAAYLRKYG